MDRGSWEEERVSALVSGMKGTAGGVLPVLHALQDAFGYVDHRAVPLIAETFQVSRAEVLGVISFYHDFRTEPPGRHVIKLCRAEACQACGCEALVDQLATRHGITVGSTTADGALTVEEVYCLGNCALGPALLVDGVPVARVDRPMIDRLVAGCRNAGAPGAGSPGVGGSGVGGPGFGGQGAAGAAGAALAGGSGPGPAGEETV